MMKKNKSPLDKSASKRNPPLEGEQMDYSDQNFSKNQRSSIKTFLLLGIVMVSLVILGAFPFKEEALVKEKKYYTTKIERVALVEILSLRDKETLNKSDAEKLMIQLKNFEQKFPNNPPHVSEKLDELKAQCDEIIIASRRLSLFEPILAQAKKLAEPPQWPHPHYPMTKPTWEDIVAARKRRAKLNAELEEGKEAVRWKSLGVAITPMDKNFVAARQYYQPYRTCQWSGLAINIKREKLLDHVTWGYKMQGLSNSAEASFNIFRNSTRCIGA